MGLASADPPDRRFVCRLILSAAFTTSSIFSMDDLVRFMMLLRNTPKIEPPLEPRIGTVINAFQRLTTAGVSLPKIPEHIDDAVIAATAWKKIPYPVGITPGV